MVTLRCKPAHICPRGPICCMETTKTRLYGSFRMLFFAKPTPLWCNGISFLKGGGQRIPKIEFKAVFLTLENF